MDITGLLLLNAGTQSSTPSRSRNPVDRLEADAEPPRRGNHAAIWQGGPRRAGQPVILCVHQQVGWVGHRVQILHQFASPTL